MTDHFIQEGMIDPYTIVAIDSTLLKAKGYVWHKSSMKKGIVPRSGIDTDARWGFSYGKGWIFGYKLHLISSTGSIVIPLKADFTPANVPDNVMYTPMMMSSSDSIFEDTCYMIGDCGYDDQKLYEFSTNRGIELLCPLQRYEHIPIKRLQSIEFYESDLGQDIYSRRSRSIEPLIEHIKQVFRIDPLPIRGYYMAAGLVLLSVLVYQILIYHNVKTGLRRPKAIKYLLCS